MIQVAHKDRVGNYVIGQGQNIIYATRFPAGLAAGVGCLTLAWASQARPILSTHALRASSSVISARSNPAKTLSER